MSVVYEGEEAKEKLEELMKKEIEFIEAHSVYLELIFNKYRDIAYGGEGTAILQQMYGLNSMMHYRLKQLKEQPHDQT